jgi:hypothetical protein
MDEGCQKSKTLSYIAKFKCEAVQCVEDKENGTGAAVFGPDENNACLWRKHKPAIRQRV